MNIDLEKIRAELEKVKALTGEAYFEENKDKIKQDAIANFEKAKQNDINILTMILNYLPNFEIKAEQQQEEIVENKE